MSKLVHKLRTYANWATPTNPSNQKSCRTRARVVPHPSLGDPKGIAPKKRHQLGLLAAEKIAQTERYFAGWYGANVLSWLEQFRFKTSDDLDRPAIVDMAMAKRQRAGSAITPVAVRDLIASAIHQRRTLFPI